MTVDEEEYRISSQYTSQKNSWDSFLIISWLKNIFGMFAKIAKQHGFLIIGWIKDIWNSSLVIAESKKILDTLDRNWIREGSGAEGTQSWVENVQEEKFHEEIQGTCRPKCL